MSRRGCVGYALPEAELSTRTLDGLLNNVLHLVPVLSVNPLDVGVEVSLNLVEHLPLFPVGHKRDGYTHTAETSRTANTVQVGLEVGLSLTGAGLVQLRDILSVKKMHH